MTNLILSPPTLLSYSLGCRTNQAEMEDICLQLTDYGLQQWNGLQTTDYRLRQINGLSTTDYSPRGEAGRLRQPDLILLNTCVVTQKAEKETRQKIRELRKKYPKSFLVVLGCGVTAKDKFDIELPEADLFIPNINKNYACKLIQEATEKLTFHNDRYKKSTNSFTSNKYQLSGRKFIKIQDGCDKHCSYCITCHLRGKPTSVPPEKIIKEINFWGKQGIKEVILTGINIGLWGKDFRKQESVNSLVKKILTKTKIERISFSSIYPEMLLPLTGMIPVNKFVKLVVDNPRITQCFHLSLQSGSQTVLERMNRRYQINKLTNCLLRIKRRNPLFTFRADIIVGFPNETEKEFQETIDFIKKAKISFIHHFHFSTRPRTKSEVMIKSGEWKEVPMATKKQRVEKLIKEVEKIRNEEAEKMIGIETRCLIVRLLSCYLVEGITENGWCIKIKNQNAKIKNIKGMILPVRVIGLEEIYLLGEILSLPTD